MECSKKKYYVLVTDNRKFDPSNPKRQITHRIDSETTFTRNTVWKVAQSVVLDNITKDVNVYVVEEEGTVQNKWLVRPDLITCVKKYRELLKKLVQENKELKRKVKQVLPLKKRQLAKSPTPLDGRYSPIPALKRIKIM